MSVEFKKNIYKINSLRKLLYFILDDVVVIRGKLSFVLYNGQTYILHINGTRNKLELVQAFYEKNEEPFYKIETQDKPDYTSIKLLIDEKIFNSKEIHGDIKAEISSDMAFADIITLQIDCKRKRGERRK